MKKILIFYGSYGGGHFSAARNIKDYIDNNYSNTETILIDCIEYVNKTLNKISTKAFTEMAKNAQWVWDKLYSNSEDGAFSKISTNANKIMAIKLNKLFKDNPPDLIISTHPFSSQMCSVLKKKEKLNCEIATIMTDYAPHSQWVVNHQYIDYFFVAHLGMKKDLINRGIFSDKIYPTGIPLSTKFLANYDRNKILNNFNLSDDKKIILFFGGGEFGFGKERTLHILETLIKDFSQIQVVAIAGKNEKMYNHFKELVNFNNASNRVQILTYTNQVPELMSVSSLVITKPGGLTTTECLASGLPIIVVNPLPGQEIENAEFLEEKGAGVWIKKEDNVEEKLTAILNSQLVLNEMKIRAKLLAKKNSTKDICEILLGSN